MSEVSASVRWLSPPNSSIPHNRACMQRTEGTAIWFTDGEPFRSWKKGKYQLLWLLGFPGSGKTILCSAAIHIAIGEFQKGTVAYHYFELGNTKQRSLDGALRSLILQLSGTQSTQSILQSFYSQSQWGNGMHQPSVRDLKKVLCDMIGILGEASLFLDALDESDDPHLVVELVLELLRELPHLRVLITTRDQFGFQEAGKTPISRTVQMSPASTSGDMEIYINTRLETDPRLQKWTPEIRDSIREKLIDRSDGMFIWAACQLEAIRESRTTSTLRSTLDNLPRTLTGLYDQVLSSIGPEHRSFAVKMLKWVAFSARPLSVAEVVDALAVDDDGLDPNQRLVELPNDFNILNVIINIDDTFPPGKLPSKGSATIRFFHASIKDYLTSEDIRNGPTSEFYLNKKLANTAISQSCLTYLLHSGFYGTSHLELTDLEPLPLAGYAASYWLYHALADDGVIDEQLHQLIIRILHPPTAQFVTGCVDPGDSDDGDEQESPTILEPLCFASFYGLVNVLEQLLDQGLEVDAEARTYGNALTAASFKGYDQAVLLLLNRGADVNAQGGMYGNALQAASLNGHKDVIHVLLSRGADINAQGGVYGNALQAAAFNGHEDVIRRLLQAGAHIHALGGVYGNALQAASLKGHTGASSILLDMGLSANVQGGEYGSALQAAAFSGQRDVAVLLLENGAEVNMHSGKYGSALLAASASGRDSVVRLLVENGADLNFDHGGFFGNALAAASSYGYNSTVEMLLDYGANVNAHGGYFGNPLQAAAQGGHKNVASLLLARGADVHKQGGYYGNALNAAHSKKHQELVGLLQRYGAGEPSHAIGTGAAHDRRIGAPFDLLKSEVPPPYERKGIPIQFWDSEKSQSASAPGEAVLAAFWNSQVSDRTLSIQRAGNPQSPLKAGVFSQFLDWTGFLKAGTEEPDYIGSGSSGSVWRGVWMQASDLPKVAVKVMHPANLQAVNGHIERWTRELELRGRVADAYIVPFVGIIAGESTLPSMVTLMMPNGTIDMYLSEHPNADRKGLLGAASKGLTYLHGLKPSVIHGNLTTSSILVDERGIARLSGFRFSRTEDMDPFVDERVGTLRWMAPEYFQFEGEKSFIRTKACDVYAFGMTILAVLSGKLPFSQYSRESAVMFAVGIEHRHPEPAAEIEPPLWDFLIRCWSIDSAHRPQSSEFASVLEGAQEDLTMPIPIQPLPHALPPAHTLTKEDPPKTLPPSTPPYVAALPKYVPRGPRSPDMYGAHSWKVL